jgi:hypothetical protein
MSKMRVAISLLIIILLFILIDFVFHFTPIFKKEWEIDLKKLAVEIDSVKKEVVIFNFPYHYENTHQDGDVTVGVNYTRNAATGEKVLFGEHQFFVELDRIIYSKLQKESGFFSIIINFETEWKDNYGVMKSEKRTHKIGVIDVSELKKYADVENWSISDRTLRIDYPKMRVEYFNEISATHYLYSIGTCDTIR